MDYVEPILLRNVEQRSLAINVFFIERQSMTQKQVKTLLFSLSADIKKDSLLIIVLEIRVGAVV
jgi:hypothetical protein